MYCCFGDGFFVDCVEDKVGVFSVVVVYVEDEGEVVDLNGGDVDLVVGNMKCWIVVGDDDVVFGFECGGSRE